MSNEISFFQQIRHKSNMFNLFRLCRKATYDFVKRIVRLAAFDNVASTWAASVDGALLTVNTLK